MTELQSELTLVHLLRAGVLFAALIVVPATAVCWNMIPKDFFGSPKDNQTTWVPASPEKSEPPSSGNEPNPETISPSSLSPSPFLPELQEKNPAPNALVKTMGGQDDKTTEQPIPSSFNQQSAIVLAANPSELHELSELHEPAQKENDFAGSQRLGKLPQQSFPVLEGQLKQLGAKYYRLEKWGSRGELFRFSCYVSPSEPYQYQKYFQAIDSDELRVMESVIKEIKQWKSVVSSQ